MQMNNELVHIMKLDFEIDKQVLMLVEYIHGQMVEVHHSQVQVKMKYQ
jgi:hypothetical protein